MRLISGQAGGQRLDVPKSVTRPTQDRVRQAVFNMLGELIHEARVLDLFAGSGALGLECLSRGASRALLVDADRQACEIIRRNAEKTQLHQATVRQGDAFKVLHQLAEQKVQFDLIFADPPYAHGPQDVDLTLRLIEDPALAEIMAPGANVILESLVTKRPRSYPAGWECVRERDYGSTRISWLKRASGQS